MSRRVAVTGIGLLTPVGIGTEATWSALVAGRNGIRPITGFDTEGYSVSFAAEVEGFIATDWMDRQQARRMDKFVQYALAVAKMAMADAGFEWLVARIRLEYLSGPDADTPLGYAGEGFWAVDATGKGYQSGLYPLRDNRGLNESLYPGAFDEGWVRIQVAQADPGPLMTYADLWWKLYE